MRKITITLFLFVLLGFASAFAQAKSEKNEAHLEVIKIGSVPTSTGSDKYFTGSVRVDTIFPNGHSSNISGGVVNFAPASRTAWHTHPKGQKLIIITGVGWVQEWGKIKHEVRQGDIVWCPPNVKHWHGGTATTGMSHYAFVEIFEGRSTDWMEKVTDTQFNSK